MSPTSLPAAVPRTPWTWRLLALSLGLLECLALARSRWRRVDAAADHRTAQ